jgi:hypothetical protein
MLIGYARVSTGDPNLELQKDALTAAGCEKVVTDVASGYGGHPPRVDRGARIRAQGRYACCMAARQAWALAQGSHRDRQCAPRAGHRLQEPAGTDRHDDVRRQARLPCLWRARRVRTRGDPGTDPGRAARFRELHHGESDYTKDRLRADVRTALIGEGREPHDRLIDDAIG